MAETALQQTRPLYSVVRVLPAEEARGTQVPRLVREWLAALDDGGRLAAAGRPGEIPGDDTAERIILTDIASRLVSILVGTPFQPESAALAGRALVTAGFTGADALGRSLPVLMLWLPAALDRDTAPDRETGDLAARVAEVTGAFADGYARALRDLAVAEAESLRRAELEAERLLSRQLRHQATHDLLTGLPNRAEVLTRLSAAVAGGRRIGLCYLDLDGFKAVNDSHGHAAGDRLLIAVAERISRVARRHGAVAARFGGDEFVVLAENSPGLSGMIALAAGVLAEARRPIALSRGVVSVSACAGIVDRAVAGDTAESVVADADAALYAAKSRGPGRWSIG